MRIKFNGTTSVIHGYSKLKWEPGEIKDIPDDQLLRIKRTSKARGTDIEYRSTVDELLRNPDYVIADSGINPNFTCVECGAFTREIATYNPLTNVPIVFQRDGHKLCRQCFQSTLITR